MKALVQISQYCRYAVQGHVDKYRFELNLESASACQHIISPKTVYLTAFGLAREMPFTNLLERFAMECLPRDLRQIYSQ